MRFGLYVILLLTEVFSTNTKQSSNESKVVLEHAYYANLYIVYDTNLYSKHYH